MDKNDLEKKKIYEWACKYAEEDFQTCFSEIEEKDSFYEKRKEETYIKEYNIRTAIDLSNKLNEIWENDEIMQSIKKVILIAALKNMPTEDILKQESDKEPNMKEQLPSYIYNF